MNRKSLRVALCASLIAACAMCAVPSLASAGKKTDRKQTRAIRQTAKAIKKANAAIKALSDGSKSLDGRIKTIEDAAPVIISSLTQLSDAAKALKTGLETAGAGLAQLGAAYPAVEFGRGAISVTGAAIAAGDKATSADIPDDGNVITTGDDTIIRATGTSVTVDLRALIRSAESDGDTAAKTAGQAGGFIQVSNADTGDGVDCTGSTAPGGIFGTQPGDSIVTPTGTVTNLPLKNIPGGNLRTSTLEPTGTDGTSLLPAGCTFTSVAATDYNVHWSVNFVDIPTSTTPGPTE
jgi:hypothetical protein